jgi:sulfite exporter TauE/SafE
MNQLILTAFALGIAGSLHCLFMCGPLALALPLGGLSPSQRVWGRVLFLMGRWLIYSLMGALVGGLGQGISWLGGQNTVLFVVCIGLFVLVSGWEMDWAKSIRLYVQAQSRNFRQHKPMQAFFLLGMGNGLIPCGLVYGVLSQSALAGHAWDGALLMLIFGISNSWWHAVLMLGVSVRLPRLPLLQVLASPRGSLALVTVFLVFRLLHSPQQVPQVQPGGKVPTEVLCTH